MAQGRPGRRGPRREKPEFDQKLLNLARVTRVVKGGRRFRFRATLVIGNRKGHVGVGVAKGSDVSDAIKKAFNDAKKNMIRVALNGPTISHDIEAKLGSARVLLKPASEGRGIIAGGAVRAVVDLLGVKDIVSKSLGASNSLNLARVTIKALEKLKAPRNSKPPTNNPQPAADKKVQVKAS
jgi:small subunit ribosomal protein S5